MSGKRYTDEFKIEAVKQVTERGHSVAEVANRLGDTPAHDNRPSAAGVVGGRVEAQAWTWRPGSFGSGQSVHQR